MESEDRLVKVDMKNFYYSGTREQLLRDIMLIWSPYDPKNRARRAAINMLLLHQYIKGRTFPKADDGAFQVIRGSGMGLIHSGEFSDAAYWVRVEQWSLRREVRIGWGIKQYLRYKDDVLVIMKAKKIGQYISTCKAKAQ